MDLLKNIGLLTLSLLLIGGVTTPAEAKDNNNVQAVEDSQKAGTEEEATDFMKYTGMIKEIVKDDKRWTITIADENKNITHLLLNNDTILIHSGDGEQIKREDLQIGHSLEAYYDKNKPMLLIFPPQLTPDFVLVREENAKMNVKVSKFDDSLLSLDNQLKLNLSKETIIENQLGKPIEKEKLANKELIVFYSVTTKSIPAQTSPIKIIAFDKTIKLRDKIDEIIKNDHINEKNAKMIPLRKVAEVLDYDVKADTKNSAVYITKGNLSYMIKNGEKIYSFNRSIGYFEIVPILKHNKIYVQEDFVEQLLENY